MAQGGHPEASWGVKSPPHPPVWPALPVSELILERESHERDRRPRKKRKRRGRGAAEYTRRW